MMVEKGEEETMHNILRKRSWESEGSCVDDTVDGGEKSKLIKSPVDEKRQS